jgi:hypothetical protein
MRHTTIRQALQHVADNPQIETDEMLVVPVHELVARTLFEIANNPMTGKRGAAAKANAARTLIFDRLVGKRQPGSHPATREKQAVEFVDMTGKEVGK